MKSFTSPDTDLRPFRRSTGRGTLDTGYHSPIDIGSHPEASIWPKAALSIGLMFALALALASMVAR